MEFPEDILRLIRQYSRPCFKYFREYNTMLRLCGFHEWTTLRQALHEKPEKVLPYIRDHEKAQTLWLQAYKRNLENRRGYQNARARTFGELVKSIRD
jgi:hypothetical protein